MRKMKWVSFLILVFCAFSAFSCATKRHVELEKTEQRAILAKQLLVYQDDMTQMFEELKTNTEGYTNELAGKMEAKYGLITQMVHDLKLLSEEVEKNSIRSKENSIRSKKNSVLSKENSVRSKQNTVLSNENCEEISKIKKNGKSKKKLVEKMYKENRKTKELSNEVKIYPANKIIIDKVPM